MLLDYCQEDVFARTAMHVSDLTLKETRRGIFLSLRDVSNFPIFFSEFQNSNDVRQNPYWETQL